MNVLQKALAIISITSPMVMAQQLASTSSSESLTVATPTPCITSNYIATGTQYWKSITLTLTNKCDKAVDFQNASISFKSSSALNTSFWGNFAPLSYPDNNLTISSQGQSDGTYLATLSLHFPDQYSTTLLPVGSSFQIVYGSSTDGHIEGSTSVYLQSSSVGDTGTLKFVNQSTQPENSDQTYGTIHIKFNGQPLSDVQIPWSNSKTLTDLAVGTYTFSTESIKDAYGNSYQGTVTPASVTLAKGKTVKAQLSYTMVKQAGSVKISMSPLPDNLSGYASNPTISVSQIPNGASVSQAVGWNTSSTISQLANGGTYGFSTPSIGFNGYNCSATFSPSTLVANTNAPTTRVTYQCIGVRQDSVTLSIQGAPADLSSLTVTMKPNDNSSAVSQVVPINEGSGSATFTLADGSIYTIQTDPVTGYSPSYSSQPLMASPDAQARITFSQANTSGGRIIGYMTGWKATPPVQPLANAGYTHVIVAFGVFSTTTPGAIVSAFSTVTKDYIASLHAANIKVLLSLGGASSSIANTTVNFHDALTAASSADTFKTTFINSLKGLMTEYGFDGFDIDIEHGLIPQGTFASPQGDIAVLADIINTMHNENPNLLISMAPQVANISATSGFDETWGNYASLIMQTYESLSWVGIQLYNTGCAYGLNKVCYSQTETASPDFSVAMADDLLQNWPATLPNGQASGFQPYISYLKPSQVVLGYPAPNAAGKSDGQSVIPTSTIIRALQCLATATVNASSCDTYISTKAYGSIGGVFEWEITYDQNNNYKFATDLKPCVIDGNCN